MLKNKLTKNSLTAIAITSAMAFSSASNAAITSFTDDFQAVVPPAGFTGWSVFSDNAGLGGYFIPEAGSVGPQITALADDGNGNQYMNFYANYDNGTVHAGAPGPENISVFREFVFDASDTVSGSTWDFAFDFSQNAADPLNGATQVGAFIRVFDPVFNLLAEATLDTSTAGFTFESGLLSVTLDPLWANGKVQVGFNNSVDNYDASGMFYDNTCFSNDGSCSAPAVPVPAAVWLFGSGLLGLVGVARRRKSLK